MTVTRLFQCGFEFRNASEFDWSPGTPPAAAFITTVLANRYTGLAGFRNSTAIGASNPAGPGKTLASMTQLRAGYWYQRANTTYASADAWFWKWTNTAGAVCGVAKVEDRIELIVAGTTVAAIALNAVSGLNTVGEWHHVGITVKASATVGFVSFYVDGSVIPVLTFTGNTGVDITGLFALVSKANDTSGCYYYNHLLDDLFIHGTAGEPDAPPPVLTFEPIWVSGAGSSAQWTPVSGANYANVDEQTANDGDASAVYTSANGMIDRYTMTDIPAQPANRVPRLLTLFAVAKNNEAGPQLKIGIAVGANELMSSPKDLGTGYAYLSEQFPLQPDAASSWSEAAVNSVIAVIESVIA